MESFFAFLSTYDSTQFISAFVVLFAIIDIIGVLPVVLNLLQDGRTIHAGRASIISLVLFIGFMYMGNAFLQLFSLDTATSTTMRRSQDALWEVLPWQVVLHLSEELLSAYSLSHFYRKVFWRWVSTRTIS